MATKNDERADVIAPVNANRDTRHQAGTYDIGPDACRQDDVTAPVAAVLPFWQMPGTRPALP